MSNYEIKNYIKDCTRTETKDFVNISNRLSEEDTIRLLHAGLGFSTESGEFLDTLKKYIYYGKQVDKVNLVEEIGDLAWYLSIALDVLNISYEEVMKINIDKLKSRYPEKFTEQDAIERDLDKERAILEKTPVSE